MKSPYARHDHETIILGNDWLERRIAARTGEPSRTVSFVNKRTGRDYARLHSCEFSFAWDGRETDAGDFSFARAKVKQGDPIHAILFLHGNDSLPDLEMHFQVFADHPVLRKWLVIMNRSERMVTLSDLNWEDLHLLVDTPASVDVWTDYFTRREKSVSLTMDECALLVNDREHHEGFIVATEAPGPLKRIEAYAQPGRIAVGYNRDDETVFERVLAPGESFTTPASFILPLANSIPQEVIDNEYACFVADHLTVCDVARIPSVTVNTWQPFGVNIDRELLREQIDHAAELGIDAYQVDDGWFDHKGDWNTDPAKFPNGLEEVADQARAGGMRFGLWMAVATADESSRVFREHPDWAARNRDGEPNRHSANGDVTLCLCSDYYDYTLEKIDAVISRYDVELLKLDLSAVRNVYKPGKYPGCFATNHTHRSPRDSHLRIVERLFDLIRTLKRLHPMCLIDLSYELYGVMDGTDLALTQVADQNWFTNIASPNEVSLRREIFQRGRVTRPWTLNFGGTLLDHPNAPHYGFFSTLASHALFWGDLRNLDKSTRAHYKKWFAWIKAQRAHSDFYRYYQVSDIFPVPDGISSRDFRHTIPASRYGIPPRGIHPPAFEPESKHPGEFWDGVARLDAHGEGPIFVFRPAASRDEKFQMRIPWVNRHARYSLDDVTDERDLGVFSGEELIERGIEVRIAEPITAKVMVLTRQ